MGKFLARLLLFLIVAAGIGYLLFPTAIDQYTLYKNAPLLQSYRQLAEGMDAARAARTKETIAAWNGRQLQQGVVPLAEPDPRVSEESRVRRLVETQAEERDVLTDLLSMRNGGATREMIAQAVERFLRAGGFLQPLTVDDPFTAAHTEAASLLAADRNGVIGILEIPRIGVTLPVYAARTEERMASGLFLGPGSSLPIGGRGTHSLLAGSGGLAAPGIPADIGLTGPKLLEDANQLTEGDLFLFSILDETLVYQVEGIETAPAGEAIILERSIADEQMTLVSVPRAGGRLIIRGKRIAPNENREKILEENAASIPPSWVNILTLAAPVMAFGLLVMFIVERVMHRRYRLPTEK